MYYLIKLGMLLRNIARLSLSPTRCLAPIRHFFSSTSDSSSAPSPTTFETVSIGLSKASSADASDQKATPATPKKKLSHQAQSAIWAERVIQYILNAQPLTDIHSPSLKQQILRLQNPDNVHQFEPEPKEKVMRLFTQGVRLDMRVFNQERIRDGMQDSQKKKDQEKKFVFCPNLLVTKEIFKYMMKLYYNRLVTGGFGISKTVSVILFIQLSNHVNSYLFKAVQPDNNDFRDELKWLKSVQPNISFFDQDAKDRQVEHSTIQLLTKKTYFSTAIPRYWYWSIRSEEQKSQQRLRQTLLWQAPQISQQKKKKLKSIKDFDEFVQQLKNCYPPEQQSYYMKVIIDQFNAVASRARQWNKKVDQYEKMSQEKINKDEYDKKKRQFKQSAQRNIQLVKSVIYLSNLTNHTYILNSSTSIQIDLLESSKGKEPQKVYFNIQTDHKNFTIQQIKYLQAINNSLIDFLHNFWFEIERKLKIFNQDNTAKTEMKRLFFEETKDKQANYFSRFLFVRQYLTEKKIEEIEKKYQLFREKKKMEKEQKSEKEQSKKEEQLNPFKGIYESFTEQCKMKCQQKLQQYILKDKTDHTLKLFYALYDLAILQNYKNGQNKDKRLTVSIQFLIDWLGLESFACLNLNTYKDIIPFSFTEDHKSIQFYWKQRQFILAVKDVLFDTKIPCNIDPLQMKTIQDCSNYRGNFFEKCVIQALRQGADATIFSSCLPESKKQFSIKPNRFTTFQPFNFNYAGNKCYEIVQKSVAKAKDDIYLKKNKLKSKQAKKFIKEFNQGKPQSQQYPVDLKLYHVYLVKASTIGQNLKGLLDKCDAKPGEFFIATPEHKKMFGSNSECIDFIIARKYEAQYQIYTFDVSISRTATDKYSDAKKFFNQVFQRQIKNSNYKVTHVLLCHKNAERIVQYHSGIRLNIIYSPWNIMTIKNIEKNLASKAFQRMKDVNLRLSPIKERKE